MALSQFPRFPGLGNWETFKMNVRGSITLACSLVFLGTVRAQDDVKATIEKAIQAHGGAEKLDKFPAGRVQSKGSISAQGGEVPFSSTTIYQLPDRVKNTIEFTTSAGTRGVTQILSGDKVGVFISGLPQQVLPAQAEEMKQAAHTRHLVRLTPLIKGDKYKLADAGEKEIGGKAATGVKVAADGYREVRMYFDKTTGMLLALERQGYDAAGKLTDRQEIFSDYREAEGIKYPSHTTVMQDGKRYIVSEVLSFKPLTKADSREFTLSQ